MTNARCPAPEAIDFNKKDIRNLFVTVQAYNRQYNNGDIRVVINDSDKTEITAIQIMDEGIFKSYETLQNLYYQKNMEAERYSLKELLEYAEKDNATKKESYLTSVLQALSDSGFYTVANPIALYDNILVGRKKNSAPGTRPEAGGTSEISSGGDNDGPDEDEDLAEYDKYANLLKYNPNLILYGPPGTGKTYAAMRIVENYEKRRNGGVYKTLDDIKDAGRVKFITFHQSYSYEEFIEGIRPVVESSAAGEVSSGHVAYRIEPGILLQMVNTASVQVLKSDIKNDVMNNILDSSRIWKVSLGSRWSDDIIYESCKNAMEIAIGWLEDRSLEGKTYEEIYSMLEEEREEGGPKPTNDANSINALVNEMKKGDIALIYDSPSTIRDIAVIDDDKYFYKPKDPKNPYPHRRKVVWIKEFDRPCDIYELNGKTRLTMKTIYELDRLNFSDIKRLAQVDTPTAKTATVETNAEPYYLIIDEINRGNISKIFGELITLVEKDKRDKISCELPYSRKPFTLPSNIYIIGTMNTADRSIAILDTALRRRFTFVELEPDLKIFDNANIVPAPKVNNNVDLQKLLARLNAKIATKIDRDHRIGHAYFLDIAGIHDLFHVWYYKVLPLLMEYFYNDVKSIKDVIGNAFLNEDGSINFMSDKDMVGDVSRFESELMKIYSS
jgi:5-methylcytosine-specific restriction protein B